MIIDFVLSLDGAEKTQTNWQRGSGGKAYDEKCAKLTEARECWSTGVGIRGVGLVDARDRFINDMRNLSGGRIRKESVLCIFGSSHGASVALAVAAALQNELSVNYICLADLPLFAAGCNPPIPGVGNLKASPPLTITAATSMINSRTIFAHGDRPRATLQPDIGAKVKENFFQHTGNAIKFSSTTGQWFWGSDMASTAGFRSTNEVHGILHGWNADQEIHISLPTQDWAHRTFGNLADLSHQVLDDHVVSEIWPKRWPVELAKF